ncbi:MAG: prenyltransferase/squalene oxidase repeat-containing protein [Pirellulales bacterium]
MAHWDKWIWSIGSVVALVVCSPALLAAADVEAPTVSEEPPARSATALHLSKLATTGPKPAPITPPKPEEISAAIRRGIQFLLDDQRPDGSWGSPENTKGLNIYAPPPGAHDAFRTGVTGLAIMALIEAEQQSTDEQRPRVESAIDRGEQWLVERLPRLRRATPEAIYNTWGHAYAIQALVQLHLRAAGDADHQARLKKLCDSQADMLSRYSFLAGGWGYYDTVAGTQIPGDASNSFVTATCLIALREAKTIGVDFPERLTKKAIASIHRQQYPNFTYAYGEYLELAPMHLVNRAGGSLGRSQVCNLALRLYGEERVTDEVIETWLDRLIARNGWLSMGRKFPVPHESHFYVAGYFYYYGHWYASQCIELLPPADRPHFQDHLAHILLPLQERDGSWWDYPFYNYHQQYGTAMAVMSLVRCQKAT